MIHRLISPFKNPQTDRFELQAKSPEKKPNVYLRPPNLAQEIEIAVMRDDGRAAKSHLAARRPIYYEAVEFPGHTVREYPDGRRKLVSINLDSVVTVILEL